MKHLFAATLVSLIAVSCVSIPLLQVPTGPGTEYPCGIDGVVCLDVNGNPNHKCCGENEVCGGTAFSGCPADSCCFTGPSDTFGARKAQRSEVKPATVRLRAVACGDGLLCPDLVSCCSSGEVCGGDCPSGYCCDVDSPFTPLHTKKVKGK
jgi:hypothetical protein